MHFLFLSLVLNVTSFHMPEYIYIYIVIYFLLMINSGGGEVYFWGEIVRIP